MKKYFIAVAALAFLAACNGKAAKDTPVLVEEESIGCSHEPEDAWRHNVCHQGTRTGQAMETVPLPLGRDAQGQGSDGQIGLPRKGFCGIPCVAAVLRHRTCSPE